MGKPLIKINPGSAIANCWEFPREQKFDCVANLFDGNLLNSNLETHLEV